MENLQKQVILLYTREGTDSFVNLKEYNDDEIFHEDCK